MMLGPIEKAVIYVLLVAFIVLTAVPGYIFLFAVIGHPFYRLYQFYQWIWGKLRPKPVRPPMSRLLVYIWGIIHLT